MSYIKAYCFDGDGEPVRSVEEAARIREAELRREQDSVDLYLGIIDEHEVGMTSRDRAHSRAMDRFLSGDH